MANSRACCCIRVNATLEELGRGLFLSRASAVAPPESRCRQVADWETGISPIISVLPGHPIRIGSDDATDQLRLPGRTIARIELRMMPPFPWSPLKFRTAGFPQYGFKAGVSGGAFPAARGLPQRSVCHRPSCTSLIALAPRSVPGNALRWCTSVRAASATLPQGPSLRSGL